MSKEENLKSNGLDPLQRLASFKAPRDLTLGTSMKPSKKTFVPNLNVARNKNKGQSVTSSKEHKHEAKTRRERNDRNRNMKHGPNIVKSSGVFSEGLGASQVHSNRVSYGSSSRDSESTATLQKPTIRINEVVKFNKELEEQKIQKILGGDNALDEVESEDFKKLLDLDAPVRLPLDDGRYNYKPKLKVEIKKEIKMEPQDELDNINLAGRYATPTVKEEAFEDLDVVNVLKSEKPTLLWIQLPDSLPGRVAEDEPPRRSQEPSTSRVAEQTGEDKPKEAKCCMSDLEEGRIGKLKLHLSGRVTMMLGDTKFDVTSGTKSVFHMDMSSLAADDDTRSANFMCLGSVQYKLNIEPNWETLLRDINL